MPATRSFRGKKLLLAIQALMSNMEARYRRAFLEFVEEITRNPDLTEIITDLRNGALIAMDSRTVARIQNVRLSTYDLDMAARKAFASGGRVTASTVGFEGRFNLQNPRAIQMARTLSDNLADVLTKTVRENLQDIIEDAVSGVDSHSDTVRRIKQEVGLSKQHAQAVKNYRRNLTQTGMSKARVDKMVEQYAKRLLKYRAETIARTEVAIAVNKGQQIFWNQLLDEGAIPPTTEKIWIAEMDAKTCDICYPLNGMLAPVDGPWMTANGPYDIAHAHPRCRCTSGLVFPSKVQKDDPLGYERWTLEKGDYPGHPFRGNQHVKVVSRSSRWNEKHNWNPGEATVMVAPQSGLKAPPHQDVQTGSTVVDLHDYGKREPYPIHRISESQADSIETISVGWISGQGLRNMREMAEEIIRSGEDEMTRYMEVGNHVARTLSAIHTAPQSTVWRGIGLSRSEIDKIKVGSVHTEYLATATGRRGLAQMFAEGDFSHFQTAGRDIPVVLKMEARNIPIGLKTWAVRNGVNLPDYVKYADERFVSGEYKVTKIEKQAGITVIEMSQI